MMYYKAIAASFNSSKESLGLLAITTLFILDSSSFQFDKATIGTDLGFSNMLWSIFKGLEGDAYNIIYKYIIISL